MTGLEINQAIKRDSRLIRVEDPRKLRGFTLIETLIGTFLMLLVFVGIFGGFQLAFKIIGQSRSKITATALANQEIEKIRSLPYESVGIISGFPEGTLEAEKTATVNNIEYTIATRIDFVIDSTDGIAPPEDDCPNDYKKVEVKVSWQSFFPGEVILVTDIAPENLAQECATGGGILFVSVFDAYGVMVPSPSIEIIDPATETVIKNAAPTSGEHYFALEAGTYKVVVSKEGYSSERSYGTDEVTTPERPHPIVLEGQLTEVSFSIDKLSQMTIQTLGTAGQAHPPIGNVTFHLQGAKIIGRDINEEPVYKYSKDHTTNNKGQTSIPDLEWDSYTFSVDPATGLDLTDTDPSPQPIDLAPDANLPVTLYLGAENSLFLTVKNQETQEPIFSAQARLYNTELGYDTTQYTDENGQTYFIPLQVATYELEVQAQGYTTATSTIPVSGDVTKTIGLEQVE